jgi:hypothetical protein
MQTEARENSIVNQIKETESKVTEAELDLARLKGELEFLRQKHADSVVIKWRDEIRKCMRGVEDQSIFTSYEVILDSIETRNHIVASRKVKNSIITTLSLMFRDGIIGRTEFDNIYYYGMKELFTDDDLTIVKEKYQALFENCRSFIENFEREL